MGHSKIISVTDDVVINKIYQLRNNKVMIDRDFAEMYGVETKVLNQAVKRNIKRFPSDFMFQMTIEELANWKSQFVTSNFDKINIGLRKLPNVFTEQGIAMLSSVLKSEIAIEVNIRIIRVFTRIRSALVDQNELRNEVEKIKKNLDNQNKNIEVVFQYLDE
jgi:hypothetical protein